MKLTEYVSWLWNNKRLDFILSIASSLTAGFIMSVLAPAFKADIWLSILAGVFISLLWFLQSSKRIIVNAEWEKVFLEQMKYLPTSMDDNEWSEWAGRIESFLRGMGLRRKSQVIRQLMNRASPHGRRGVAEGFLQGLMKETTFRK